jgi:hypothetical protein
MGILGNQEMIPMEERQPWSQNGLFPPAAGILPANLALFHLALPQTKF